MLETKEVTTEELLPEQAAVMCAILNPGVVKFEFATVASLRVLKTKKDPSELFRPFGWEFKDGIFQKCNLTDEEKNQGIPVKLVEGEVWA